MDSAPAHAAPTHIEVEVEFEKSFERQPISYSWGFFAYDDSPGAAGGGSGNFSWFDSKEDLVHFLQKFPLLAHSSSSESVEQFEKAKTFLAALTPDSFDQMQVSELNKINSGIEQIQWYGQLNDLLTGDTEFATGMRKFFSGKTSNLAKSQIPEFVVFLRNWGH